MTTEDQGIFSRFSWALKQAISIPTNGGSASSQSTTEEKDEEVGEIASENENELPDKSDSTRTLPVINDALPEETLECPEVPTSYIPVKDYEPDLRNMPGKSPTFIDVSLEFLRREISTLRHGIGGRKILTHKQWFDNFSIPGQLLDEQLFHQYLMEYEWPEELLQEGWKYLFDYYEVISNRDDRLYVDAVSKEKLELLLLKWKDIIEDNKETEEKARINKLIYLINKDTPRTDRDLPFYRDNSENTEILKDLLITFCYDNSDLGYIQGMNDLMSLFVVTIEDKVAAYYCFCNYIKKNKAFFNSQGLITKLNGTAELLLTLDWALYTKLCELDCKDMLFCQRWLLLGFKRESKSFDIAVKIFTMINCYKPTHYVEITGVGKCELLSLDMFLTVAVLLVHKNKILSFRDQADMYTWVGQLKISDMAILNLAKDLYDRHSTNFKDRDKESKCCTQRYQSYCLP